MKRLITTAALLTSLSATTAFAAPQAYVLDASHSQIVFSYNHLGYSTTYGMFSGFEGDILFDADAPAESAVKVSFPVRSMMTGWEARFGHFMSDDFFGATEEDMVTFESTSIEVTGDNTALITGDLTMNDVTKAVVLETTLNQASNHPMAEKPWIGFDATATVLRSDFNVGNFAPFVSDEVQIMISIEGMVAE